MGSCKRSWVQTKSVVSKSCNRSRAGWSVFELKLCIRFKLWFELPKSGIYLEKETRHGDQKYAFVVYTDHFESRARILYSFEVQILLDFQNYQLTKVYKCNLYDVFSVQAIDDVIIQEKLWTRPEQRERRSQFEALMIQESRSGNFHYDKGAGVDMVTWRQILPAQFWRNTVHC